VKSSLLKVAASVSWPSDVHDDGEVEEWSTASWFTMPDALNRADAIADELGYEVIIELGRRDLWQDEWGSLAPMPGARPGSSRIN
jgi:hypothetical protein